MLLTGKYREIFEHAENVLGRKATVSDFHSLYTWCMKNLILLFLYGDGGIGYKASRAEYENNLKERFRLFDKEYTKLNNTFGKFASKIETPNSYLKKILDKLDSITNKKEPPGIIKELIDALQLHSKPIEGKYKPINKSDRQFIFWIVNNLYDDRLTPDNYSNFIQCNVNENTIKRYYNNARDEKNN